MTKTDIVAKVAAEMKVSKAAAARALDVIIGSIETALKKGDKVAFIGFGTFSAVQRKARKGRNPRTGKQITIAAKKAAKFSAGATLKAIINGKALPVKPKAKKTPAKKAAKKPGKK